MSTETKEVVISMAEDAHSRTYPNPPIAEAVIDIRVSRHDGWTPEELLPIGEVVSAFNNEAQKREIVEEGVLQGIMFRYGNCIFQARSDAFVFSMRKPYLGWQTFYSDARKYWSIYKEVSKVADIQRVAVRFINRIELPDDSFKIADFFNLYPTGPTSFVQNGLKGFFMQVLIPQEDLESLLLLTLASDSQSENSLPEILFDIDLSCERIEDPWKVSAEDEAWNLISKLRDRKNLVFESSITDKTRGLFE